MPKIKTCKTAIKRFKVTGNGKILRKSSGNAHMMLAKSPAQKRRLEIESEVTGGTKARIKRLIPNAF